MLEIRKAAEEDKSEVWEIIKSVIATGDTYVFTPDATRGEMLDYWFSAEKKTYVAVWSEPAASARGLNETSSEAEDRSNNPDFRIVGTFYLKANQPGLGAHIANAGYMVAPDAKGLGVGRRMAEFSLDEARRLGFTAMQFNFVVKSNEVAVRLWRSLGFEIIGEIPEAFQHRQNGLTNAYIMYRKL